jgi:hypothetical protein
MAQNMNRESPQRDFENGVGSPIPEPKGKDSEDRKKMKNNVCQGEGNISRGTLVPDRIPLARIFPDVDVEFLVDSFISKGH